MRVAYIQIISYAQSIYKILNLFIIVNLLQIGETCSPPNTLGGDYSIRKSSILERAEQAKIIIVGSVIGLRDDRFRRSVTARIAVHVKLKGDNVSRIVNVSGFNTHRHKKNVFRYDSLLDCTGTNVELYGTYLFFLKYNRHKLSYHVDEIAMQPAVVQIPCNRHHFNKMLKRFRKLKSDDVLCYVTTRTRTRTTKKCLRKIKFWKIIHKFTYNNVRTRTLYCSLKNISSHNSRRTRKTNIKLHDHVPTARTLFKRKYKKLLNRKKRHFIKKKLDTISSSLTKKKVKRTLQKSTLLSAVDDKEINTKWRLLERSGDNESVSFARTIYLPLITMITCILTSILLTY